MAKVIMAMVLALVCAQQERPEQERPGQDKPGQDRPGQPGMDRGANQDLDAALSKAGLMNNYTANISINKSGMTESGREPGREPGPGPRKDQPGDKNPSDKELGAIEFRLMPGSAAYVKSGDIEGYRQGDVFIVKDGSNWKRIDSSMTDKTDKADKSQDKSVSHNKLAMIRPP